MDAYAGGDVKPEIARFLAINHVTFWVGNAKQAASYYCTRFGFEPLCYRGLETGSREVASHVVRQNNIVFVFESPYNPTGPITQEMGSHQMVHGDGVKDVAFRVEDSSSLYRRAIERGGSSVREPWEESDENGTVTFASVKAYGDTIHTFVERKNYSGLFLPNFRPVRGADVLLEKLPCTDLQHIDHVVANLPEVAPVVESYEKSLMFHRFWSVDESQLKVKYSSLRAIVVTNDDENILLPVNEPAPGKGKSQIQEYIDYYGSGGIQHIALYSNDIITTLKAMKERGVEFLSIPATYYATLRERLLHSKVDIAEPMDEIQRLNILVDYDESGYLLQIFTKPCQDRPTLFIEIIQRHNFRGFGLGNFKRLFEAVKEDQRNRGNYNNSY